MGKISKRTWLIFFLMCLKFEVLAAQEVVGDRILFEIDNKFYSQRQMEIFLLVRSGMEFSHSAKKFKIVTAENWEDAKTNFEIDMKILKEATRLGSYNPSEDMVQKNVEKLLQRSRQLPAFVEKYNVLGVNTQEIYNYVGYYLQIDGYQKAKSNSLEFIESDVGNEGNIWLSKIKNKFLTRWLSGSEKYLMISPGGK